jgi:hypothetical protein
VDTLLAAVRARQRRQLWLEGVLLGTAALLVLGVAVASSRSPRLARAGG